ncbi:uncharacterized protein Dwil_GK16693 [Drosophila willistoni]|uniref:DUF4794 domain-containing protein n=1 Tax=Drosophila willistoni TaxID=7260 RepID=B4MLA4_DROWI|nr:uncharacterized protein LOC6638531 [Drosophila willistoni]EDW73362.2 uncharacterized protein Dwil_GK16693 [Drosophila willistoni]
MVVKSSSSSSMFSVILVAILVFSICNLACAAPYQELEPRKGHVPVYIRTGDEPLSEIHPGLAEAFKEGHSKPSLQSENLVTEEVPATATTIQPNAEEISSTPKTSTESDIASFDAIKAKAE